MKSTRSKLTFFAGVILFTAFGSQIASQTGVAQWQMVGFVLGLLLCSMAHVSEVQSRLRELESKVAEIDARISS